MQKSFFSFIILVFSLLLILLSVNREGRIFYEEEYRDTTIYNITYRDTTIYNIVKKDSLIIDYTLVPITNTVTINDTVYMNLPMLRYWFQDEYADIYAKGYNVSLDSIRYHFREVTKKVTERVIVKPRKFSIDAGMALYKSKVWTFDADMEISLRLHDVWIIKGSIGMFSDGSELMPYAGAEIRYRIF